MLVLGLILILLSAGIAGRGAGQRHRRQGACSSAEAIDMPTLVVFLPARPPCWSSSWASSWSAPGVRRANENRKTKKKLRTLEKREGKRTDGHGRPDAATAAGTTAGDGHPTATGTRPARRADRTTRTDGRPDQTPPPHRDADRHRPGSG